MIDLAEIKARLAAMPRDDDETAITRRCLAEMLEELAAGRAALQREGATFGLKGQAL